MNGVTLCGNGGGTSGGMSGGSCSSTSGMSPRDKASEPTKPTVKEHFDEMIENSRKTTERLCVNKAKLELLGLLDMPHQELQNLVGGWFNV